MSFDDFLKSAERLSAHGTRLDPPDVARLCKEIRDLRLGIEATVRMARSAEADLANATRERDALRGFFAAEVAKREKAEARATACEAVLVDLACYFAWGGYHSEVHRELKARVAALVGPVEPMDPLAARHGPEAKA